MIDGPNTRPVLSERYELEKKLARGGMADVYLARDMILDRKVAIKVLFPQFAVDPDFVERFRREAQAAGRLNHPNIVAVYDWGSHESTYFIAMEYVEGQSLSTILSDHGPLELGEALPIIDGVLAALDFAHGAGTVHRDIKPGNVVLTHDGAVKVADFGIARALDSDDDLTQTGKVMGTAGYFSPEQARGEPVDQRSDLYSVGIMMFEMLVGERPFKGNSPLAVAYHHIETAPAAPSSHNPAVPPEMDAVVASLLAKRADDRYPSAEHVQADLRRFLSGEPLAQPPVNHQASPAPAQGSIIERDPGAGHRPAAGAISGTVPTTTLARSQTANQPRRGNRNGMFIFVATLLLVAAIGLSIVFADSFRGATQGSAEITAGTVSVPNVVGQPQREASELLVEQGLVVEFDFEESDVEPGLVSRQDPEADSPVASGSAITIFISRGEQTVGVPSVAGQEAQAARAELTALGFTVALVQEPSETVAAGRVISQNIRPGEEANRGAEIGLVISSGPPEAPTTSIAEPTTTASSAPTTASPTTATTSNPTTSLIVTTSTSKPTTTPTTETTTTTTTSTTTTTTTTTTSTTTTTEAEPAAERPAAE